MEGASGILLGFPILGWGVAVQVCSPCENVSRSLGFDLLFCFMLCMKMYFKNKGIAHIMGIVLEVPGGRMAKKHRRPQETVCRAGKPPGPMSTDVRMGQPLPWTSLFSRSVYLPDELRQKAEQGDQESNHILLPHLRHQDTTQFSARREKKLLSLIKFDIWIITLARTF